MTGAPLRQVSVPVAAPTARFREIGRLAVRALYHELVTYPKPGLVSMYDSGAHADMDARTFMRSLFVLRGYFHRIAAAGAAGAPFGQLRAMGLEAEAKMMTATDGVNTHRGAIFSLGLLCAAAGRLVAADRCFSDAGDVIRTCWGPDIRAHQPGPTHGRQVARRHGVQGARAEAATGFPHVFGTGCTALRGALARGHDDSAARVQCFFRLLAVVPDTNLWYRGGRAGYEFARNCAQSFLRAGGVTAIDWRARAEAVHRAFVARSLSPGGTADLLAATLFVHDVEFWLRGRAER